MGALFFNTHCLPTTGAIYLEVEGGRFHTTGTPKMQSQKRNFTILQLQDFLMNYKLYEMIIPFGFYILMFISICSQNFIFFGIKEPTKWSPFIACHSIKNTQMQ
jgi:hypothetical protein